MKEFRAFLLSRTGWQDENGNTVVFSETNLTGETAGDGLWLFLDEGLRCGRHAPQDWRQAKRQSERHSAVSGRSGFGRK